MTAAQNLTQNSKIFVAISPFKLLTYLENVRQVKEGHHRGTCIQHIGYYENLFPWMPFSKTSPRDYPNCITHKKGRDYNRVHNIPPF